MWPDSLHELFPKEEVDAFRKKLTRDINAEIAADNAELNELRVKELGEKPADPVTEAPKSEPVAVIPAATPAPAAAPAVE